MKYYSTYQQPVKVPAATSDTSRDCSHKESSSICGMLCPARRRSWDPRLTCETALVYAQSF
eukprot:4448726-Pleurochrysis_carterae.AAC.1